MRDAYFFWSFSYARVLFFQNHGDIFMGPFMNAGFSLYDFDSRRLSQEATASWGGFMVG